MQSYLTMNPRGGIYFHSFFVCDSILGTKNKFHRRGAKDAEVTLRNSFCG